MAFSLQFIEEADLEYDQEPPGRIRERARKVLAILKEYKDKSPTFDKDHTRWAAARISDLISDSIAADIVYNELAVLTGSSTSMAELVRFACSIAGSVHYAKLFSAAELGAVDVQAIDCWAIVKSMVVREDRFGRVFDCGLIFANSVFAGSKCVVTIRADKTRWWCIKLGLLGSFKSGIDFHTSYQLLGASMICRASRLGGQISVDGAGTNSSVISSNRQLAKSRSRGHTACPFDFGCDCGRCDVGTNECKLSTYQVQTTIIKELSCGESGASA